MYSKNFADINDRFIGIGKVLVSHQSIQQGFMTYFGEDLVPGEVHEITGINGAFGNYNPKLFSFTLQGQVM